jgi:uncharacterized protein YutE (UPF0331/DUF86 family)/predicted nucleotidyltransferase
MVRCAEADAQTSDRRMTHDPLHRTELDRVLSALLASHGGLRLAVLFGSTASGRAHAESDIHIAFLPTNPDLSLDEELAMQVDLTRAAGRDVDLVRLDHAPTLVRWHALRDGILLFQSAPFELTRAKAAAASEYLDFAPALEAAAARLRRRIAGGGQQVAADDDATIVLRKLASLREHVGRMRRRRPPDAARFRSDVDLQDAIAMSLLVAVQEALDIALHMASDEGWGLPASYVESFELLARHNVMASELATELSKMAALRNRLAHGYASVDVDRLYGELPVGIDALEKFAACIAAALPPG